MNRTSIPGLLVVRLELHEDSRGWFKENWQSQTMRAVGVPDFRPVQNNMSLNTRAGATRGIHTEPWDKLVSVATGRVFAAWVDMREGDSFGTVVHMELGPETGVFVPRGVGNSYQALEHNTVYSYLVNDHWRPGIAYPSVNLGDQRLAIPWPIPLTDAEISDKDLANPMLNEVTPVPPRRTLIIGAGGQLGRALGLALPHAERTSLHPEENCGVGRLDATSPADLDRWEWRHYETIINAAAFTDVDEAETPEGRLTAWRANAGAPAALARIASEHGITLVHFSSDYVFDGTRDPHVEDEPLTPLGVYAQSKAAGDVAVATSPRHYLIRTSWVVGDGHNFVRTMWNLARNGAAPAVIDDQVGRLTFTDVLVRATRHLLDSAAPFGTYNVSNGGQPTSWFDIATEVFSLAGRDRRDVERTTTALYAAGKGLAPRPSRSVLDLSKIEATGFRPEPAIDALKRYCEELL